MNETPRILILAEAAKPRTIEVYDKFVMALNEQLGGQAVIEWRTYRDIRLELGMNRFEAFIQSTGEPLNNFRFVYFKSYTNYNEQAAAIAAYLDALHVPFACSELRSYMPLTKLTQHVRMALAGVPIAQTVYMDKKKYGESFNYLADTLGVPFIFKAIDSDSGHDNYLIRSDAELQTALTEGPQLQFIAQRFIENNSDLRVLIIGRQIELIIRRSRHDDSHLNNTSQGASAELVPLSELSVEHQTLALQAAALMDREIAGVDLMLETPTGNPYILEVNASPQIATGAFANAKLTAYSNYFKNMLK